MPPLSSPRQEGNSNPIHISHQEVTSFLPPPFPPLPSAYPPVRYHSSLCETRAARASDPGWGALHSCWRKETEHGLASLALEIMSTNLAHMKRANLRHLTLFSKKKNLLSLLVNTAVLAPFIGPLHGRSKYLTYHFTYSLQQVWNGGRISLVFKMRGDMRLKCDQSCIQALKKRKLYRLWCKTDSLMYWCL